MTISVVMIEDSKEIVDVVQQLISQVGPYRVVASLPTETEATDWLQRGQSFDVAVVDLVLRDGSGFNLLGRLRSANEGARILVLSDYATPGIRVRCVELGADAVFSKGEIRAFASYLARHGPAPVAA